MYPAGTPFLKNIPAWYAQWQAPLRRHAEVVDIQPSPRLRVKDPGLVRMTETVELAIAHGRGVHHDIEDFAGLGAGQTLSREWRSVQFIVQRNVATPQKRFPVDVQLSSGQT